MTNFFSKLQKIATIIAVLALFTPLVISQPAFAAGLEPFNADRSNPNSLKFVYAVNAGESKQDDARVTNTTTQPVNVEVLGRDGEITSDGAFTVISNTLTNQKAGAWIQLDQTTFSVPANSAIKVPFKVNVPQDTPSGEYYAGLSVIETGDANNKNAGNVTVKTRLAVKMFITVKGDLSADTSVKGLNIIDPKDADYNIERAKYGAIGRENMYVRYEAENTGNLFLRLATKYKVSFPDGSVSEGESNQDLAPSIGNKKFYIETKQPFQVGKTKVELSYEAKPINEVKDGATVTTKNVKGTLTDELDLTQADLDNFAASRVQQNKQASDEQKNGPRDPIIIKEAGKKGLDSVLIGIIIALLVALVALQVFNILRKKKNETDTTKK
jgi:hypothetical protein